MFAFASLLAFTLALSVSSTVVPEVRDNQIQARQGEVFQGGLYVLRVYRTSISLLEANKLMFSASFFNQGGVAGACGQVCIGTLVLSCVPYVLHNFQVHSDSDLIAAIGLLISPFSPESTPVAECYM